MVSTTETNCCYWQPSEASLMKFTYFSRTMNQLIVHVKQRSCAVVHRFPNSLLLTWGPPNSPDTIRCMVHEWVPNASVFVKTLFRSRDQDRDLGLQASRPRPLAIRSRDWHLDKMNSSELESRDHGLEITARAKRQYRTWQSGGKVGQHLGWLPAECRRQSNWPVVKTVAHKGTSNRCFDTAYRMFMIALNVFSPWHCNTTVNCWNKMCVFRKVE